MGFNLTEFKERLSMAWVMPDHHEEQYRFLRTLAAALIAFGFYLVIHQSESYWLVLSAVLMPQMSAGNTFKQKLIIVFSLGLISAIGVFLASTLSFSLIMLAIFLFIATGLSIYIGLLYPKYFLSAFFVNFFILLAAGIQTDLSGSLYRFADMMGAVCITLVLQAFFWPWDLKTAISETFTAYLNALSTLSTTVMSLYLKRDYTEKHYLYEKELHREQQNALYLLNQCRRLLKPFLMNHALFYRTLVKRLESSYESIISLGLLRYRLQDEATLSVGEQELNEIKETMKQAFTEMVDRIHYKYKKSFLTRSATASGNDLIRQERGEAFHAAIQSYQKIYLSVINVVAKNPILFLFFIRDLFSLQEGLSLLCTDIQKLKNHKLIYG